MAGNSNTRTFTRTERYKHRQDLIIEPVARFVVLEQADGLCGICGEDVDPYNYHVDHIIPVREGGEHSYANTQPAHPMCNYKKGGRKWDKKYVLMA